MDMAVYEAGGDIGAFKVHDLGGLIVPEAHHAAAVHGHVGAVDVAGEGVYHPRVLKQQVHPLPPAGDLYGVLYLFQVRIHVHHIGTAL